MKEIFAPTASCSAIGLPHCSRAADHSRAIFRHHLPAATQDAGSERRPVLRVVRAILRPAPSGPMRFAAGTLTWWKRVTPFSMPRRPMKALRFSTVMPGESVSTTKAVMPPLPSADFGTRAITTRRSAITPLVVQSFTPSRTYASPSRTALVASRAGSEPTSGSVSRKALMSVRAQRGRNSAFCSSVPNSFSGCGTPIDWCAESSTPTAGQAEPASASALL